MNILADILQDINFAELMLTPLLEVVKLLAPYSFGFCAIGFIKKHIR